MIGHTTVPVITSLLGVVVSLAIGFYALRNRHKNGAIQFSALALGGALWSLKYAAEFAVGDDLVSQVDWEILQLAMLLLWPLFFLALTLHYPERPKRRRPMLWIGLGFLACVLAAVTLIQRIPSLMQSIIVLLPDQRFITFMHDQLLMTRIRVVWSGTLFAIGLVILLKTFVFPQYHARRQAGVVLIGALIAAGGVIMTMFGIPLPIDPGPAAFGLSSVLMAWGILAPWPIKLILQARNTLANTLPAGVFVVNARSCLLDLNAEAISLLASIERSERSSADVLGKPLEEVLTAWPDFLQWYRDNPEGSTEIQLGIDAEHPRTLSITMAALRTRKGALRGRLITLYDITDRIRTENTLHRAETELQQTRATLQATDTHLQETRNSLQETEAHLQETCDTLQHTEEMLRHTEGTLEETETARQQVEEALHAGTVQLRQTEDALHTSEGRVRQAEEALKASERERELLEDALLQARENEQAAQAAAQTAEQARNRFLNTMSTAFYTPVNAILGFSKFMTRDPRISSAQREHLAIIYTSGERLLAIIHDTLDMVAIESGSITIQSQNCDLYQILRDLEDTVGDRTSQKDVKYMCEQSSELPQYIRIDADKLQHILRHSVDMAIKSTKQGSVTLKAGLVSPDQVEPEIVDGGGNDGNPSRLMLQFIIRYGDDIMSPDDLIEDDGLGPALSRRFVELLHGQMVVESQDGGGFVLQLTIPAESGEARPSKAVLPERRQIISLAPEEPICRILVAHRDAYSRLLLQKLLQTIGFSVQETISGKSVIEIVGECRPHLICLDMHMPDMDGYAVVRTLRAEHNQEAPAVAPKVFALTVGTTPEEQERALAVGCDDVLSTPFRESEIFGKIATYLDVNYVYDTPTSQVRQAGGTKMKRLPNPKIPEHLATLPAEVLHALEVAAAQFNPFKLSTAVETIWLHDASLADAIEALAYQNNYKTLSSLVKQTQDRSGSIALAQ